MAFILDSHRWRQQISPRILIAGRSRLDPNDMTYKVRTLEDFALGIPLTDKSVRGF